MTLVSCPICAGPVELTGDRPGCLIGHTFESGELQDRLGKDAETAAIRALEDTAGGTRWRLTLPHPPEHLDRLISRSDGEARMLRGLVSAREGLPADPSQPSTTEARPDGW